MTAPHAVSKKCAVPSFPSISDPLSLTHMFCVHLENMGTEQIITLCLLAELTMIEDHLEDELEQEMHHPKLHKAKRALFPK